MNINNSNSIAGGMRYQRAQFDDTEDYDNEDDGINGSNYLTPGRHLTSNNVGNLNTTATGSSGSTNQHHPLYDDVASPLTPEELPDFTRQPPPPLPTFANSPSATRAGPTGTGIQGRFDPNDRWSEVDRGIDRPAPPVIRPKDYSVLNHDQDKNPYETPRLSFAPAATVPGSGGFNGGFNRTGSGGSAANNKQRRSSNVTKGRPRGLANKVPFLNTLLMIPLNFWGRRTGTERSLISVLGLCLFAIMVLSILVHRHKVKLRTTDAPYYTNLTGQRSADGPAPVVIAKGSNVTTEKGHPTDAEACLTPYCISISARLLNSMNLSADPCHDFYEYSCGGWIKENNIPDGQSSWNNFQALFQKNQYILKRILEKDDSAFQSRAELKAKIYYDSCLDENDTIEALGAKPLLTLLNRYGGWNISAMKDPLKKDRPSFNLTAIHLPFLQTEEGKKILNRVTPESWDFQDRMERISIDLDISLLFSVYVSDDDKNSSQNALYIDMGRTSLPKRDYYLNISYAENGDIYRAYLKYMTAVGVLLAQKIDQSTRGTRTLRAIRDPTNGGVIIKKVNQSSITPAPSIVIPPPDQEQVDDPEMEFLMLVQATMKNILDFETRIANFTPPPETLRDGEKNYNRMTVRELQTRYNFLNWTRYLNSLLELVNVTFTPDHDVVVRSTDYMGNMTELIKEYLTNPDQRTILNNYFMWHVTSRMIPYLSQDFRATLRPLSKALKGSVEGLVPWRACISDTNNIVGFPLGSMFVKETFEGENKHMAEKMINRIKIAFKNQLPTLDWMDEETIKVASEKADAIRNKIGFPEYLLNPKELDEKYDGLDFKSDEYFENNLRQLTFFLIKGLERIKEPVDKTRWSLTPPMVNAYYLATGNEMVFPAGILQSPFYDSTFPKALNFGAMGFVVGHELTHGFDDQGRQFDKNGNLKSWWNNASIARFNERADCLEKQYSNYKIEQININGKQTIGENIADNGGLKATFSAFKAFIAANPEAASRLPGLNMTDNQLFFLAFSQVWCSIDTKKSLYYEILNDSHSPNKIRVIGTLANSVEFAKAFDCPLRSPMNPVDKCVVW